MRRVLPVVAGVLGCVLLLLGVVAGVVNRNVVDGPRFAAHVDAMRTDTSVARELSNAITDRVLRLDPDLVAVRPLVQTVVQGLVTSDALGPVVRQAASALHTAVLDPDGGSVVLRLADVGAVLTAALRTVAPDRAASLPPDFDVTLATFGSGSFGIELAHEAHNVTLLSWLLPLLGLLLLAAGIAWAPDRYRAGARTGFGISAAGSLLAGGALLMGLLADRWSERRSLKPVLLAGAWHELDSAFWWAAALLVLVGALVALAAAQLRDAAVDRRLLTVRRWRVLLSPGTATGFVARALLLAFLGLGLLQRPEAVVRLVAGVAGLGLIVAAAQDLLQARAAAARAGTLRIPRGYLVSIAMLPPVLVLGTLVVVNATGTTPTVPLAVRAGSACNGAAALCSRSYDQVVFPATHNSMSAADAGWFLGEQPTGIVGQLDAGVRVFLIDSWYGQPTNRSGVVATAEASRSAALAQAEADYGKEVVASALRIRQAANLTPTGPRAPYLCHGLCELGATPWEPEMARVKAWMDAHPREVVSFFIEDEVTPDDTAKVFESAGLLPFTFTPTAGKAWPTLGEMIDSNKRLVVLMQRHGGGAQYPWLLQGFDWVQDTPYTNPTVADLSCTKLRGNADSPLLLLNHWLASFTSLVSDARRANSRDVLLPVARSCQTERGRLPSYVAVNWYDQGDLFGVVDTLNGVTTVR